MRRADWCRCWLVGVTCAAASASSRSCLAHSHASPVNIVPHDLASTWSGEENFVRLDYGPWKLEDVRKTTKTVWSQGGSTDRNPSGNDPEQGDGFPKRIVLSFNGTRGGGIQVGTRYNDFDEYILRAIQVHTPSEHTFLGRRLPLEVQLWHEPMIQRDLDSMRQKREEVQARLADFHEQVETWGEDLQDLQAVTRNISFPSLSIEQDLVAAKRRKIDEHGEEILRRVWRLEEEMKIIDEQTQNLMDRLARGDSGRLVVISVLFRASDPTTPSQAEASKLLAWLSKAVADERHGAETNVSKFDGNGNAENASTEGENDNTSRNMVQAWHRRLREWRPATRQLEGQNGDAAATQALQSSPEVFEFARLPYQGIKDVGVPVIRSLFSYEGSFTEPPCTPVVRWFVSPEPLIAYSSEVVRLVNSTPSAIDGKGVWWGGDIAGVEKVDPPLPQRQVEVAALSISGFQPPMSQLNSDTVATLPWVYVNFYCGTFLICSVLMLCTTFGMCAQRICEQ